MTRLEENKNSSVHVSAHNVNNSKTLKYLDIAVTTDRTSLTDNGQLTRMVSQHKINTRGVTCDGEMGLN